MLKIKDNVDLKELEKFGFEESKEDYNYWGEIIIEKKNRIIDILELDILNIDEAFEKVHDLSQAGLVEKVEK